MHAHLHPNAYRMLRIKNVCSFIALVLFAFGLNPNAFAQPATGTITGRIFNPATQEYVRNAEITVEGTNLLVYSADDGTYALTNVPAGNVTVAVNYTGYDRATAAVNIGAGQTAIRDFELKGTTYQASGKNQTVVMGEYVVSSEREGNAKAIMEQRAAVNFKSVVSSDNFGDLTGGTVGEFIKYLPGVVMDYVDSDARTARISGLEPRYASVTVDGMNMASAGNVGFDGATRQFEFEQASINGTEAIEISKTTTASMDADAPAGRINLRSRSAFDRKRRELTATLSFTGNEYSWSLKKTPGPYDGDDYKVRPGFIFSYAEAFKQRFGIALTIGANTVATEQSGVTHAFNYAQPARGPLITQITFRDAPKLSERASFNLTTDYKVSPYLSLSLRTSGSHFDDGTNNRQILFVVNQAQITPQSTLTDTAANATANANTRIQINTSRRNKVNNTVTFTPKIEYKHGDLTITTGLGLSRGRTAYEQITEGYFQNVSTRLTRMSWAGRRSSTTSGDWTMTQLSGPSWTNPNSFNRSDAFANNVTTNPQSGENHLWVGYLDAKKSINLFDLPVQIGAGWKTKLSVYDLEKDANLQWTYVGAANNQLAPTTILPTVTRYPYDPKTGGNVSSLGIPLPDVYTTLDQYLATPSWFAPTMPNNHIQENFTSRSVKEQIDAGYVEGNTRWRALRLNLGVRGERTRIVGKSHDLVPAAEVRRATGITNQNDPRFIDYQYRFGQRSSKYGGYEDVFLSGGAKWAFTRNLHAQFAASQSIGRPSYANLAGVITIDDANRTVRVPNPDLKPETSDKYFTSVQYYLEPAGTLSVSGFRLFVENMGSRVQTISAAEAGYADDPEYDGYTFQRVSNAAGTRRIDGIEVEYSQQLVFLPRALRGFSVFGSVTRTRADERIINHVPKSANGGIRYGNHKFNAQVRCTWSAPRLTAQNANEEQWQYERLMFDFSGGYKINQTYELTISGRNILNEPIEGFSNEPGQMRVVNRYGAAWTIGVRGRW
jgi:iron complex outermembrane recepter protein